MDILSMLLCFVYLFLIYILFRNWLVYLTCQEFIDYFYNEDPDGYDAGSKYENVVPDYSVMLFKFWVWPLSSFYPAYHQSQKEG